MQAIYWNYCTRHFEECKFRLSFDSGYWKEMSSFAGWNFIGGSASLLKDQGVNILLNLFIGPVINAARGIANTVNNVLVSFSNNFMTALNPQITKSYAAADYGYTISLVEKGSRFSYYILLLFALPILFEAEFVLTLWLKHYPDPTKSRGQYLPLLEKSIREYPNSDRNMHYLGREYMFYGMYDKSIETLKRHLEMPQATWKDERAASMRFIARGYKAQGNFSECEAWYYRAIGEAPHLREPYYEMASFYYERQNFEKGYYFTKLALQISERPTSYINEAAAWNGTIYDIGAVCAFNVRQYQDALEWVQEALSMDPDNERLKNNLLLIQRHRG
jgi:tetratricopeptide (TPR) repeat protein